MLLICGHKIGNIQRITIMNNGRMFEAWFCKKEIDIIMEREDSCLSEFRIIVSKITLTKQLYHSCRCNHLHQSLLWRHGPLTRYVKLRVAHAPWMSGTFSPPPRINDPGMHHGTCATHVSWWMPGSQTSGSFGSRWRGKLPGIPGACTTRNFTYLVRGPCHVSHWLIQI